MMDDCRPMTNEEVKAHQRTMKRLFKPTGKKYFEGLNDG